VAVNADPGRAEVEKFIAEKRLDGMIHLFEPGKKWESVRQRGFRIQSLPFSFVLDKEGIVRYRSEAAGGIAPLVENLLKP
jgi:hypothetical protein